MTEPHETHVCRDCGAKITLPYARVDQNLEGYWERAYWRIVPELQDALAFYADRMAAPIVAQTLRNDRPEHDQG